MVKDIRQILDAPISYFFDDMLDVTIRASARRVRRGINAVDLGEKKKRNPMMRWETLELVSTYYSMEISLVRKRVVDIVKFNTTTLAGY